MDSRPQGAVSVEEIWRLLAEVPDPEIPVLSVVDLGIIRKVEWRTIDATRTLCVAVTPTYSGCPATDVIAADIGACLTRHGIDPFLLETHLSPAWTTDWISDAGRRKLREYGIAPPRRLAPTETPGCPRCGATNTERVSQFGSTPCKALYRCRACLEPFDFFKCL